MHWFVKRQHVLYLCDWQKRILLWIFVGESVLWKCVSYLWKEWPKTSIFSHFCFEYFLKFSLMNMAMCFYVQPVLWLCVSQAQIQALYGGLSGCGLLGHACVGVWSRADACPHFTCVCSLINLRTCASAALLACQLNISPFFARFGETCFNQTQTHITIISN